ncbi:hypothetical protein FHETE_5644 [Fusarium heterosporum]|uniref:Uncharacterized protein n=1 Tax=Fusarium heterosporum TaxID=42747 RepID=A0A8H5TAG8_FUSHE|nr:hypothetical protein FHETE_5644 [Fusarium heterosporum]
MAYYFQPPIFGNYLLPPAPTVVPSTLVLTLPYNTLPLYWQPAPIAISAPRYIIAPTTRIKVIFHRAGTILGSNDACYNYLPSREAVLGNLAWWSKGHGLEDRAYSGQCTLYITRSYLSTLHVLPETGPVTPSDTLRKVSFAEQLPTGEFQSLMYQIAMNGYGAFILVDHAYVPLQLLAQESDRSSVPTYPPSPPPTPPLTPPPQPRPSDSIKSSPSDLTSNPQAAPPPSNSPSSPDSTSEQRRSNAGNSTRSPKIPEPEGSHTQTPAQSVDDTEPQPAGGEDGGVANG